MGRKYVAWIPPAQPMKPLGEYEWFAKAKVKQTETGRADDITTVRGEWHGKTKEEAEAKARRAAEEWISEREEE